MKPLNVIKNEEGKVTSFDIDRKHWHRGNSKRPNGKNSSLWDNEEDTYCCLGFYSLACGAEKERLDEVSVPSELFNYDEPACALYKALEWLDVGYSDGEFVVSPCENLIQTNDSKFISDELREADIKAYFREQGITVNFV
jgi:hypothetical protein